MGDAASVLLCTCRDAGELQMVRAALEARGVPVRIDGAAVHGVLGMIHGAALAPRVLVPPQWLPTARAIVTDIVGPFDDDDAAPDAAIDSQPFRTAGAEPDDALVPGDDDDDDDDDDDAGLAARPRPRSLAIPLMLGVLGLAWGFGHIYARRATLGVGLMVIAALALVSLVSGVGGAAYVLGAVWLVDVVGAMVAVHRDNRALAPAA